MPQPLEQHVLDAAKAGETRALAKVVDGLLPVIKRLVWLPRNLQSPVDSEELLQDALLRVVRDFHTFRGKSVAEMRAWATKVVLYTKINRLKASWARRRHFQQIAIEPDRIVDLSQAKPLDNILDKEIKQQVACRLGTLPIRDHTIVVWLLEGCQLSEIADLFGASRVAIYKRIVRALPRLQAESSIISHRLEKTGSAIASE